MRKAGSQEKRHWNTMLPAFLPSSFILCQETRSAWMQPQIARNSRKRTQELHDNRKKIPEFFFFFLSASLGGHFMSMHGETQKSPMHDKPNIPVPPKQRKKLKTAPARTPADQRLGTAPGDSAWGQRLGTAPGDSGAENLKNKSKATNKNMKNKTQTLACPQASSTRASGPLRKKHRMSSAALAGLVLALAPAAQAAIIIDNVEDEGDYTFIHTTGVGTKLTMQ